jgi:hypothetical protein
MEGKIIEAGHSPRWGNWGKFEVCRPDAERARRSAVDTASRRPLLAQRGWSLDHLWVLDWETGEAVLVRPGGSARADLRKHHVHVCPLFEPFLEWLYQQDLTDLQALPDVVYLPGAPFAQFGYRRGGQQPRPRRLAVTAARRRKDHRTRAATLAAARRKSRR